MTTTDMTELLPCPFCGGAAKLVHIEEGENAGGSCVCCTKCMASGNVEFGFKENYIAAWNRRASQAAPAPSEPVTLTYTNWQGKTAQRTITPVRVWFGSTPWHPEPQWLLTAVDAEKGLERDFALKDFGDPAPSDGLREAAGDLLTWFDVGPSRYGPWIIPAGPQGVDDAVASLRAALSAPTQEGEGS